LKDWPGIDELMERLAANYSKVMSVPVNGEPADYLLWDAADVRKTYGRPDLQPDVEHLAIAILGVEGALSQIATANWDGLVEKAFADIGGASALRVVVTASDIQADVPMVRLIKFHGCAVCAAVEEATYRPLLVVRHAQIDAFTTDPIHRAIVQVLTTQLVTNPTLMIGLSAQDSNIRLLVAKAAGIQPWKWPADKHACVFCGDELTADHAATLEHAYGTDFTPNVSEIRGAAIFPAFGKPLLMALLLYVVSRKLIVLAGLTRPALSAIDLDTVSDAITKIRNGVAAIADVDTEEFLKRFVRLMANLMAMFEDGGPMVASGPVQYRPLSTHAPERVPIHHIPASGRAELALAFALLAMGHADNTWVLGLAPSDGIPLAVSASSGIANVFFVANEHAAIGLSDHHKLDGRSVVVHSMKQPPRAVRSPAGVRGRTGSATPRVVSIAALMGEAGTLPELMTRFRHEAAL
jgi:hypothetical protein